MKKILAIPLVITDMGEDELGVFQPESLLSRARPNYPSTQLEADHYGDGLLCVQ